MSEKNLDTLSNIVPDKFGNIECVIDETDMEYLLDPRTPRYPFDKCKKCENQDKQRFLKCCLIGDKSFREIKCDYDVKPIPEVEGVKLKFFDGSESPTIVKPGDKNYDLIAVKYMQAGIKTECDETEPNKKKKKFRVI